MSSSTSGWSEVPLLHICIVCSQEFQQRKPILQFPSGPDWKNTKILDEFNIFFGLQCLNLSITEAEKLFGNLVDVVGEPGNWRVSFCQYHDDMLKKALEVDLLIKRLQNQLKNIKGVLGTEISQDFRKDKCSGGSQNIAFQMIRNKLMAASNQSQSSSTKTSTRKTAIQPSQRKRTVQQTPQSTVLNSEFNETEFKAEVPATNLSPIVNSCGRGGELGDSVDVKIDVEEEEVQILEHDIAPVSVNYERNQQMGKSCTPRTSKPKETQLKTIKKTVQKRVTQPRVIQPRVTQPRVTQPRVTQPRVNQPRARVTQPRVNQPRARVTQPRASKTNPKKSVGNNTRNTNTRSMRSCKCKFCPMTFITSIERDNHINGSHGLGPRSYVSATVTQSPISPSENIQSRIQQLLKGQEFYKCFNCQEEFPSSALINRHKRYCDYTAF